MDICIITSATFPPEEGIGNYITNMSRQFVSKGHKVTIITRGKTNRTTRTVFDDTTLYRVPFYPVYPFHVHLHGLFLKRLLKRIGPGFDVIHYHTPLPPAIKVPLPVVTTVHTPMRVDTSKMELVDLFSVIGKLQGRINYFTECDLFRISDRVTSVARSVSEELQEYGLDPGDVPVIGNGVDEKVFTPVENREGGRYVLYTGRLSYRKGLFDFVKAGIGVCERCPDVRIKITGKGPLYSTVVKMVASSGYGDRFELLGHVTREELIRLYQNAAVFVMPSHYEGLPTTLLEAMACGLPVVATAVSGNLDVVEPGKNGLLVPARAPEQLESAIVSLLEDREKARELGLAARRTIEEKFTWDAISDKILNHYREVIGRRAKN